MPNILGYLEWGCKTRQARSQGGFGGSIEPPILGSVCCACANMLPSLIITSRTYTLGASATAQPCLTVELAEFTQIIKLAMSLGQGKAYTRPYFRRATRACADAVRPAALHCSILCIRELCLPPNLKRYDWSGFGRRQSSRIHNIEQCSAAGRRGRIASAQARVARRKD